MHAANPWEDARLRSSVQHAILDDMHLGSSPWESELSDSSENSFGTAHSGDADEGNDSVAVKSPRPPPGAWVEAGSSDGELDA